MIDTGTIGKKFRVLTYLAEKLDEMPEKSSKPALKLLESLNKRCNSVSDIEDIEFKKYLLELFRRDFYARVEKLPYGLDITTRLRNYIKARTSIEHN